jgi:DNA-directed RNA polymerase specialized sigma24 family protein
VQGPGGAEFPSDLADLEQLAPLDRAVLYLTDVDGYSLVDVANHLGLTHDAARLRASRARRRLRLVIENEEQ